MSAKTIASLPASVKLIVEAGTGYNNIDLEACNKREIMVCNVPSYSSTAVASLVLTFMLSQSCSLVQQQRKLFQNDLESWKTLGSLPHFELEGKIVGLIGGRGAIGSKVADMALAMGMTVLISSRSKEQTGREPNVRVVDRDTLLKQADFVSIHCPLNEQTRGSLGKAEFEMMKPESFLINTARGAIVDEPALIEALQTKQIAGAGLDVQAVEPPAADSPLYKLPSVLLLPHIGWQRIETRQRLINMVADNILAYNKKEPQNVVNAITNTRPSKKART